MQMELFNKFLIYNISKKAISFQLSAISLLFLTLPISLILTGCSSSEPQINQKFNDLIVREQRNFVQLDSSRLNQLAVDFVIEGSKLQQQNKFAEAILSFQDAMKYDSSASILYAISKCYLMLGKYEKSFEVVVNALDREKNFIPAMELLTELYVYRNNIKDAILVYQSVVNLQPTTSRKSYLARLYEYENIDTAIVLYEELLKQKEDAEILFRLAGLYEKKADTSKMIHTYEKLVKYSPNKQQTYDALIRIYLDKGNYDKVMQILDTVRLNFIDDDINYFYNLTGNYMLEDSNEIALKYMPNIISIAEKNFYFDWRMNMIAAYLADRLNDSVLTEKFFNRALKSDTIPDIALAVSFHYLRKTNYDKAIAILDEYNPKFPQSFAFPFYKGLVYQNMDSNELAINQFHIALSFNENNIEVLSQIGLLYDQMKKYDSCEIAYRKVLSLEPDNALINNNFAYSLAVRGLKLDSAMLMSQKSLQLEPENPSYLDTYGWIQYQLGYYELALDYILKAIRFGEENSEVLEHLGFTYLKLGRKEDAKNAWEKSLTFEPDNDEIKKQLELLK